MWSLWSGDRRRRTGRGFRAAIASLLLPGAGQFLLGERRKGLLLLGVSSAVGATTIWLVSRGTTTIAGWVLQPETLMWLLGVDIALVAFRLYATFDAYADGARPSALPALPRRSSASVGVAAALLVMAAVIVVPHATVGYYAATTHGLLSSVFVADGRLEAPVAAPSDGQRPTPAHGAEGEADPAEGSASEPADATSAATDNPWQQAGRITIGLFGSDGGAGRAGQRIDTLLVVTADTRTGDTALFSIDRYLADFPLPGRIADVYAQHCLEGEGWRFINALYRCGHERAPEAFAAAYPNAEDPAAAAVADVLSELLGIGVPHYALVDMDGFVAMIDALGGVELDLAAPLTVRMSSPSGRGRYSVELPEGRQLVDGSEALAFVRVRERNGGDADRMRRQRCLVDGVLRNVDIGAVLRAFPGIADAMEEHVVTSIPVRLLPELIEVIPSVDPDRVVTLGFGPPDYRGWDHRPDIARIQGRVRQVLAEPDAGLAEEATVEVGDAVCGGP